jgi:hypothetical protein
MLPVGNFAFLGEDAAQIAQLGVQAERYFRDDPGTAIFKLRQFGSFYQRRLQRTTRSISVSARPLKRHFVVCPLSAYYRRKPLTFSTRSAD